MGAVGVLLAFAALATFRALVVNPHVCLLSTLASPIRKVPNPTFPPSLVVPVLHRQYCRT